MIGRAPAKFLEGENAVQAHRDIMGATNVKDVAPGTIRTELAESIEANMVHSDENAAIEIAYFFKPQEIIG
jgi:nucleoside-diphosphate kinase